MAAEICGVEPAPPAKLAVIRRLVFEAYSLTAADARLRVERREDDTPRKLAQAEKPSCYAEQAKRLAGISMTGELEPSYHLIDLVYGMAEEGQLKYVKWQECTKRDQEIMGIKNRSRMAPDSNRVIRETRVQELLKAECNTDLKLRYALQRRSLAFDQAAWWIMMSLRDGLRSCLRRTLRRLQKGMHG